MERDSGGLQQASSERSRADVDSPAKKTAPILSNGPSSILHEHSEISPEELTGNVGKVPSSEITVSHRNGHKTEEGQDSNVDEAPTRDSTSSADTGTGDSEERSTKTEDAGSSCGKENTEEHRVEEVGLESDDEETQSTQTSFVNELALSSTGISSVKDGTERDCHSDTEELHEVSKEHDSNLVDESHRELDRYGERASDEERVDISLLEGNGSVEESNHVGAGSVKETDGHDMGAGRDAFKGDGDSLEARRDDLGQSNSGGEGQVSREMEGILDNCGRDKDASSEDRNLEQFSEILLDSDLSGSEEEEGAEAGVESGPSAGTEGDPSQSAETSSLPNNKKTKRVRFADEVPGSNGLNHHAPSQGARSSQTSLATGTASPPTSPRHKGSSVKQHSMKELITGVEMPAEYLGSTPILLGGTGTVKAARMYQAQQAVQLVKDPENESRPRFAVNVKISTSSIIVADRSTGVDLMDHPLHTITYVADIDRVLVIMAHVLPTPVTSPAATTAAPPPTASDDTDTPTPTDNPLPSSGQEEPSANFNPKLTCHILDAPNARNIAMVIGQAFSAAYKQALRVSGVKEDQMEQAEYAHILNAQSVPKLEVESLGDRNKTKKLTIAKHRNDMMGIMVTESGYGSAIPALVIAHLSKTGSAAKSALLNVGDHILSINGVNLVGMPRKNCIEQIKKCRPMNVVKMEVCSCPAVVDVTIVRPDLKYQLGFTVHDGMICSLMRGSIAERSGVRVGHRIIEINGTSTVGLQHAETVHLLSSTVGDLHIRTMSEVMYRLLTGKIQPEYY